MELADERISTTTGNVERAVAPRDDELEDGHLSGGANGAADQQLPLARRMVEVNGHSLTGPGVRQNQFPLIPPGLIAFRTDPIERVRATLRAKLVRGDAGNTVVSLRDELHLLTARHFGGGLRLGVLAARHVERRRLVSAIRNSSELPRRPSLHPGGVAAGFDDGPRRRLGSAPGRLEINRGVAQLVFASRAQFLVLEGRRTVPNRLEYLAIRSGSSSADIADPRITGGVVDLQLRNPTRAWIATYAFGHRVTVFAENLISSIWCRSPAQRLGEGQRSMEGKDFVTELMRTSCRYASGNSRPASARRNSSQLAGFNISTKW